MNISRVEVERYLSEVFAAINAGRYQISVRQKNQDIYMDYVFTEKDAREVIQYLIVISFHKQEYPLDYKFK